MEPSSSTFLSSPKHPLIGSFEGFSPKRHCTGPSTPERLEDDVPDAGPAPSMASSSSIQCMPSLDELRFIALGDAKQKIDQFGPTLPEDQCYGLIQHLTPNYLSEINGYTSERYAASLPTSVNRYTNMGPWDHNLYGMGLMGESAEYIHYINASRIDLGSQRFFASEAPKPNRMFQFMRMVWNEDIPVIVNLTECVEVKGGKAVIKAQAYWPESEQEETEKVFKFADETFILTLKEESVIVPQGKEDSPETRELLHLTGTQHIVKRTFSLQKDGVADAKEIVQYHYRYMPDHGAPGTPEDCETYRTLLKLVAETAAGRAVHAHCSAGVGRTGTFLACYFYTQHPEMISDRPAVDAAKLVLEMRAARGGMVQSKTQFDFIVRSMKAIKGGHLDA